MKVKSFVMLLIAVILVLSSCGPPPQNVSDGGLDNDNGTGNGKVAEASPDDLTTLTVVTNIDSQTQDRIINAIDETPEDNRWNDLIAEELGYKIEYIWITTDDEQYNQKFNSSIAAGDIPDIVRLGQIQFGQAVDSGLLAEIGTLVDEYASPLLKEIIADAGPLPTEAATINEGQYALPKVDADIETGTILWVREDWLNTVDLEVPTTIDDMIEVMQAFNGLVGDGAVGLAVRSGLFGGDTNFTISGFFNAYDAYPDLWIEKNGRLEYGTIQPEMKDALSKLNEIYEMGLIDPEFIVKDESKVGESIASSKSGLFYGSHHSPLTGFHDNIMQDEEAVWKPYHLPYKNADGTTKVGLKMATDTWFASSVDSPAPEAVIELANLYCEKTFDPEKQEYEKYSNPGGAAEGLWKYSPVYMMTPLKNIDTTNEIRPYLEAGNAEDTGGLFGEQLTMFKYALEGQQGDREMMGWNSVFGIDGSCQVQYEQQILLDNTITSAFYGAPTPAMTSKGGTIGAALEAEISKIINGQNSLDAFDSAVQAWLEGGGQEITDEVNKWYEAK